MSCGQPTQSLTFVIWSERDSGGFIGGLGGMVFDAEIF